MISTGLLIVAEVALISAEVFVLAIIVSPSGWVILPAIASLFQPGMDRQER